MSPIAVFIASHISSSRRIPFLIECIVSLTQQTVLPHIYLSLSFETPYLQEDFTPLYTSHPHIQPYTSHLHLFIRPTKTPQMRHFQQLAQLENLPQWILFCDDDDTYSPKRIAEFLAAFALPTPPDTVIAGAYESTFNKTHQEHRHEYWCYGIHRDVLHHFFNTIEHPDVLNHSCSDILFAEYFRRLALPFYQITTPMYHYRRENNDDSITGDIVTRQKAAVRQPHPPPIDDIAIVDYLLDWNDYLHENLRIYLHDTFLRTVVGIDFDEILRAEFQSDYPLLDFVDQRHIETIEREWKQLREVCEKLYRIPF